MRFPEISPILAFYWAAKRKGLCTDILTDRQADVNVIAHFSAQIAIKCTVMYLLIF